MASRPAPLNLDNTIRDDGELTRPRYPNMTMELPSPRAGDTPPALSPLDAFALHSTLLAKRFDREAEAGRRLSRLPPRTVAKELANRPSYFKAQSRDRVAEGGMGNIAEAQDEPRPGTRGGGLVVRRHDGPRDRPVSQSAAQGRVSRQGYERPVGRPALEEEDEQLEEPAAVPDYFHNARVLSPEPVDPRVNVEAPSPNPPSLTSSIDSYSSQSQSARQFSDTYRLHDRNLLPLRSMPKSPRSMQSIRAVRRDSGDEDNVSQHGTQSGARKFSGSSGMSIPQSPFTPSFAHHHAHRSPSLTSEYSMNGLQQSPRPALNFSRPDRPMSPEAVIIDTRSSIDSRRSLDSRPSGEVQPSIASSATQHSAQSPPRTRKYHIATGSNASDSEAGADPGQTYVYTKFALPRGRGIDRQSMGLRSSWIEKQFTWNDGSDDALVQPVPLPVPKSHPSMPALRRESISNEVLSNPVMPAARSNSPASVRSFEVMRPGIHNGPPVFSNQQRSESPARSSMFSSHRPQSPARSSFFPHRRQESPARSTVFTPQRPDSPARSSVFATRQTEPPVTLPVYPPQRSESPARSSVFASRRPDSPARSSVFAHRRPDSPARASMLAAPPADSSSKLSFSVAQRPASPAFFQIRERERGRDWDYSASTHRSRSADPRGVGRPKLSHTPSASISTDSTERTIQPMPLAQRELSTDITPEDHLEIGIQAHSNGQTNKSTYHFRLAANAGLSTAMLLYALACRHGWGMRPNQEEGVKWLRKAIEQSNFNIDQTLTAASRRSGVLDPAKENAEKQKQKTQLAAAVYELGMSYSKGWGCPKDKVLALRLYETASSWGDSDALTESAYCYAQGIGCKKDMYKAASLYRKAAGLGMSMAGNSWIYKEKYLAADVKSDDSTRIPEGTPLTDDGKDSRRAKSRSIWNRPKK